MKKVGRNDPCPCGSGKKFKKCCESKMIGGRYKASPVAGETAQKVTGLTSLFQANTQAIPKKPSLSGEEPPQDPHS